MSGFDTTWLDLREPADHAARDAGLARAFADALPPEAVITDLGSGTGSTLRALEPLISGARWRLTDLDPALLAEAERRAPTALVEQIDLAANLEKALSYQSDAITASALIDLCSQQWIERLVAGLKGRVAYIALTYDGTETWSPPHPDDAAVLEAFLSDQQTDKGFGPALGPRAGDVMIEALTSAGYKVKSAASPWQIEQGPLMAALADGIAGATEKAGVPAESWRSARIRAAQCQVGHVDILALP